MFRTFHIKVNHIKEKRRRFLRIQTHTGKKSSGKIYFEVYRGLPYAKIYSTHFHDFDFRVILNSHKKQSDC